MYKKNVEGASRRARRRVINKNIGNKRSEVDKPFFAMPSYMNTDYQKIKEPKTPEEFMEDFANEIKDIMDGVYKKEELFERFPDGKFKGQKISSFGNSFETMNYILWTLYTRRDYKKLIRSILHHNNKARRLTKNGKTMNSFIGSKGMKWDSFRTFLSLR
jgi:hypothetical protein